MKRLTKVKLSIPAGMEAAIAAGEYHARNILSTNCCIVHALVLKIRGNATPRTSEYPPRLHHICFSFRKGSFPRRRFVSERAIYLERGFAVKS
jgi:hypothetical protein